MSAISEAWKCEECGSWHEDKDDANDCCYPRITEGWKCDQCGDHHYYKTDAEECCYEIYKCVACYAEHDNADEASACCGIEYIEIVTPQELEDAGQQRINF